MRTGPVVTLEVAKHAAVFQGLGSILSQPSPELARGNINNITIYSTQRGVPTNKNIKLWMDMYNNFMFRAVNWKITTVYL